jgi:hypothetical protein
MELEKFNKAMECGKRIELLRKVNKEWNNYRWQLGLIDLNGEKASTAPQWVQSALNEHLKSAQKKLYEYMSTEIIELEEIIKNL